MKLQDEHDHFLKCVPDLFNSCTITKVSVDGFYYYEPTTNSGAYSEELLGALLSELQKLNAKWKEEINQYFDNELKKDQV